MNQDRLPPQNLDAERGVLGACLRDNRVVGDLLANDLHPKDFYTDAHQKIFSAIVALYDRGRPVDMVSLGQECINRGFFEDIGNAPYIAQLWECAPTAANALYHANIVRDKAIQRSLIHSMTETIRSAYRGGGEVDSLLADAEKSIFALQQTMVHSETFPLSHCIDTACDSLDARIGEEGLPGLSTGFCDIDAITSGLQPGELILLAARPSVGKTSLGLQVAVNVVETDKPVMFFSLEQSRLELTNRMLCCEAMVDGHRFRKGYLDKTELSRLAAARDRLRRRPLFINDASGQTVTRIAANARRMRLRHKIELVVIDYLQLIESEDRRANRQEQVAGISRRLKGLARELQVPVLCLAQLNRNVEYRSGDKPKLADLRDSGSLEQDADTVFLLHRPEDKPGVIELDVAKQRNGPTGDIALTFLKQFTRFENFAPDPYVPADCVEVVAP